MNTYDFVKDLQIKLEGFVVTSLPAERWAQLGNPVMTCESLVVGGTGIRQEPISTGTDRCGMYDIVDVSAGIARECQVEFREDGTTSPEQAEQIAQILDTDTDALMSWADSLEKPSSAVTNVQWQIEGGLVATILTTSVYDGW